MSEQPDFIPPKLPLILYDNECVLCQRFRDVIRRFDSDGHFSLVPLQEKRIYEVYPELDEKECRETVHLLDSERKIYQGGDVITYLVSHFPTISRFAWLIEQGMGKRAVDYFYKQVNEYRKSGRCCGS